MSVLYHSSEANMVTDALSRLSTMSVDHVKDKRFLKAFYKGLGTHAHLNTSFHM